MNQIRNLEPKELWNNFSDLNTIPRGSKKEQKVIQFVKDFGNTLRLETIEDSVGNVIVRKPATAGMENRKPVVLQSHLDMVWQKNNDTNFDFDSQGIEMYSDGDWVKARGTTLGADNGMGVATIMSILQSNNIAHPAIEVLFTIDEETGMTGANGLKEGLLEGEILLNLDTENDSEIDIGCAGAVDVTATGRYDSESTPENFKVYRITVKGLNGGHSGMDIHKGFGNANKIMNRLLYNAHHTFDIRISEIDGGGLRNAIPRESVSVFAIDSNQMNGKRKEFEKWIDEIKFEFKTTESNLDIQISDASLPDSVMLVNAQSLLLKSLYAAHDGVYKMSADVPGLVETSNNVARVIVKDGTITISCLTRSSVESSKFDLANMLRASFEMAGCDVTFTGSYPGWVPNVDSPILKVLVETYEKLFGEKPNVEACHAGLECGIIGSKYPGMDMVSFGPTIKGAHSPDERVSISSVQKYWTFVQEILKNIPFKN